MSKSLEAITHVRARKLVHQLCQQNIRPDYLPPLRVDSLLAVDFAAFRLIQRDMSQRLGYYTKCYLAGRMPDRNTTALMDIIERSPAIRRQDYFSYLAWNIEEAVYVCALKEADRLARPQGTIMGPAEVAALPSRSPIGYFDQTEWYDYATERQRLASTISR